MWREWWKCEWDWKGTKFGYFFPLHLAVNAINIRITCADEWVSDSLIRLKIFSSYARTHTHTHRHMPPAAAAAFVYNKHSNYVCKHFAIFESQFQHEIDCQSSQKHICVLAQNWHAHFYCFLYGLPRKIYTFSSDFVLCFFARSAYLQLFFSFFFEREFLMEILDYAFMPWENWNRRFFSR